MSNPAAVSPATEAAVEAYLATWNETDAPRRQAGKPALSEVEGPAPGRPPAAIAIR